ICSRLAIGSEILGVQVDYTNATERAVNLTTYCLPCCCRRRDRRRNWPDRSKWSPKVKRRRRPCDVCLKPVCEKHSTEVDGQVVCDRCQREAEAKRQAAGLIDLGIRLRGAPE